MVDIAWASNKVCCLINVCTRARMSSKLQKSNLNRLLDIILQRPEAGCVSSTTLHSMLICSTSLYRFQIPEKDFRFEGSGLDSNISAQSALAHNIWFSWHHCHPHQDHRPSLPYRIVNCRSHHRIPSRLPRNPRPAFAIRRLCILRVWFFFKKSTAGYALCTVQEHLQISCVALLSGVEKESGKRGRVWETRRGCTEIDGEIEGVI